MEEARSALQEAQRREDRAALLASKQALAAIEGEYEATTAQLPMLLERAGPLRSEHRWPVERVQERPSNSYTGGEFAAEFLVRRLAYILGEHLRRRGAGGRARADRDAARGPARGGCSASQTAAPLQSVAPRDRVGDPTDPTVPGRVGRVRLLACRRGQHRYRLAASPA